MTEIKAADPQTVAATSTQTLKERTMTEIKATDPAVNSPQRPSGFQRVFSAEEVARIFGVTRTTVYKFVDDGTLPRPIRIGGRTSKWLDNDIKAVFNARCCGVTASEVRALVEQIHAMRSAAAAAATQQAA